MGEQFIWPRDADAPGRKIYRCANCDISVGGPAERVAPVDDIDLAKLGIERPVAAVEAMPETSPRTRTCHRRGGRPAAGAGGPDRGTVDDDPAAAHRRAGRAPAPAPLPAEAPIGGDGPRYASTVLPEPAAPQLTATDVHQAPHYQQLRDRFPVLDGRIELIDELLDLYTSRNLYALQTIANKIDAEIRDPSLAAASASRWPRACCRPAG